MYAGGRLSDYWQKRGIGEGALRVGVVCGMGTLLLIPAAYLLPQVNGPSSCWRRESSFCRCRWERRPRRFSAFFRIRFAGRCPPCTCFCSTWAGSSLGPLMPGLLNDRVFHNGKMVGESLAITIGVSAVLMLAGFRSTYRAYRRDAESLRTIAL